MRPVHEAWTIHRSNSALYRVGRLSPADTSASNPFYDMIPQHPLAGASLGFYLPGSGSTMIANKVFLGLMIIEWKVRFTSIKPPNITRSLAHPSVRPLCIESEEANALVQEEPGKNPDDDPNRRQVLPVLDQP